MKRRGFLGLLGAAAVAPLVLRPDVSVPAVGVDLASEPDVGAVTIVIRCDDRQFQAAISRAMSHEIMRSVRLGQRF